MISSKNQTNLCLSRLKTQAQKVAEVGTMKYNFILHRNKKKRVNFTSKLFKTLKLIHRSFVRHRIVKILWKRRNFIWIYVKMRHVTSHKLRPLETIKNNIKLTYFGSYKPLISNITKLNQDGNQSIGYEKLCLYKYDL